MLRLFVPEDATFDMPSLLSNGSYQTAYDALRMLLRRNSEYISVLERETERRSEEDESPENHQAISTAGKRLRRFCLIRGYDVALNQVINETVPPLEGLATYREDHFEEDSNMVEPSTALRFRESTSIGSLLYLAFIKFQLYKARLALGVVDRGFLGNSDLAEYVGQFMVGERAAVAIMNVDSTYIFHQCKECLSMVQAQNIDFFPTLALPSFWDILFTGSNKQFWCNHPEIDRSSIRPGIRTSVERRRERAIEEITNALLMWKRDEFAWAFLTYFVRHLAEQRVPLPSVGGRHSRPHRTYCLDVARYKYVHIRDHGPLSVRAFLTRILQNPEALQLCRDLGILDSDSRRLVCCPTLVFTKLAVADRLSKKNLTLLFGDKERLSALLLADRQRVAFWFSTEWLPSLEVPRNWDARMNPFQAPVDMPQSLADGHSLQIRSLAREIDGSRHYPQGEMADLHQEITRGSPRVLLDVDELDF
jgi:hypothetical protein